MSAAEPVMLNDSTVCTIPELQKELKNRLTGTGPVAVDISGVQRPTTAQLQLLAAFVRDLRAQSRAIEWRGRNAAFDRAARVLGMAASLGLPAEG